MKLKFLLPCLFLLLFINTVNAQSSLPLVVNGVSKYVITVPKNPTKVETKAASVLQQYIFKISNCKLPIDSSGADHDYNIAVGATKLVKQSDTTSLGGDGYVIRTEGNSLLLSGGAHRGVLYSVTSFLSDYLDCKYLAAGSIETPVNSSINLNTPLYKKSTPTFNYRMTHYIEGVNNDYCDWHRLNYFMEDWGLWVHSFKTLLPPDQYFAAHPEYYALVNGKRVPDQLDLSNPDVLRLVIANLKKMIGANPNAKYWSVSQNDNNNYCQCPNCKRLDDEQDSHQGSLLTFVNAVAKQFPGNIISTLAYGYSLTPPKNLRPEKNVMIMVATGHDRHVPIPSTPDDEFDKDLTQWKTLTANIFIWDYIAQFGNALSPFPDLFTLQPNIIYFSDNGVSSVFEQGIGTIRGEFSELKCYLVSELMWNKNIDYTSKLTWFVNNYYGKAGSSYILQYLNLLNSNADKSTNKLLLGGSPLDGKNSYLSNDNLNTYNNLFKSALSSTGSDSLHVIRIAKEYIAVLYAQLENNKTSLGDASQKRYYTDILNQWYKYIQIARIKYINESRSLADDYYKKYSALLNQ